MLRYPILRGLVLSCLVLPMSVVANDSVDSNKKENAAKPDPVVTKVCVVSGECDSGDGQKPLQEQIIEEVRLGQSIRVEIDNLPVLQERQRVHCKEGTLCQEKRIHLFLNLMELKGVSPLFGPGKNELQFRLPHRDELPEYLDNKEQKAIWAALFGFRDKWEKAQSIDVSVGLEDGHPLSSHGRVTLVKWTGIGLIIYCVMMAVILILYGAGFKRGLFSDRGIIESGTPALSLARVQMSFWFLLVIASFLFIWLVIGELPKISTSILVLIGIASGTTLGAALIDGSKRAVARGVVESESKKKITVENLNTSIEVKIKERQEVQTSLLGLSPENPYSAALVEIKKQQSTDLSKSIEQLEGELRTLKSQLPSLEEKSKVARSQQTAVSSRSFLDDLFSDENGWSFHRVQMGVWTLVLGLVFVKKVLEDLAMPDFDETLLALMGISSGTYLGFKFPEQQPGQTNNPNIN